MELRLEHSPPLHREADGLRVLSAASVLSAGLLLFWWKGLRFGIWLGVGVALTGDFLWLLLLRKGIPPFKRGTSSDRLIANGAGISMTLDSEERNWEWNDIKEIGVDSKPHVFLKLKSGKTEHIPPHFGELDAPYLAERLRSYWGKHGDVSATF